MSEMEVGVDVPHWRRPSLCCPDSKSSPSCSPSSSLSSSSSSWNITPYLDDVEDQENGNEKEKGNGNVV